MCSLRRVGQVDLELGFVGLDLLNTRLKNFQLLPCSVAINFRSFELRGSRGCVGNGQLLKLFEPGGGGFDFRLETADSDASIRIPLLHAVDSMVDGGDHPLETAHRLTIIRSLLFQAIHRIVEEGGPPLQIQDSVAIVPLLPDKLV